MCSPKEKHVRIFYNSKLAFMYDLKAKKKYLQITTFKQHNNVKCQSQNIKFRICTAEMKIQHPTL